MQHNAELLAAELLALPLRNTIIQNYNYTIGNDTRDLIKIMRVLADLGLLDRAEYIPSPNCDLRPNEKDLALIVVHGISLPPNHFGGPEVVQLFTNQINPKQDPYFEKIKGLRVSAHLFIRRDGSIIQFVPFHKRAWHAGISDYNGREKCNDFSIGIELEGTDHTLYTAIQYESLAAVIKAIWVAYPQIPKSAVAGHCDIAPNRKTDPGPFFFWSALQRMLADDSLDHFDSK